MLRNLRSFSTCVETERNIMWGVMFNIGAIGVVTYSLFKVLESEEKVLGKKLDKLCGLCADNYKRVLDFKWNLQDNSKYNLTDITTTTQQNYKKIEIILDEIRQAALNDSDKIKKLLLEIEQAKQNSGNHEAKLSELEHANQQVSSEITRVTKHISDKIKKFIQQLTNLIKN